MNTCPIGLSIPVAAGPFEARSLVEIRGIQTDRKVRSKESYVDRSMPAKSNAQPIINATPPRGVSSPT